MPACPDCGHLTTGKATPTAEQDRQWLYEHRVMKPGRAAAVLGVTTTTVLAWAHEGWIRHCLDGGTVAYASPDVHALADLVHGHGHPTARLIRRLKNP